MKKYMVGSASNIDGYSLRVRGICDTREDAKAKLERAYEDDYMDLKEISSGFYGKFSGDSYLIRTDKGFVYGKVEELNV